MTLRCCGAAMLSLLLGCSSGPFNCRDYPDYCVDGSTAVDASDVIEGWDVFNDLARVDTAADAGIARADVAARDVTRGVWDPAANEAIFGPVRGVLGRGTWTFPRPTQPPIMQRNPIVCQNLEVVDRVNGPVGDFIRPVVYDGWYYHHHTAGLYLARTSLRGAVREHMTNLPVEPLVPEFLTIVAPRRETAIVSVMDWSTNTGAIVEFGDITRPGVVLAARTHTPEAEGRWSPTRGVVATDQFIAWTWSPYTNGPSEVWVAGPHGEDPRRIPFSPRPDIVNWMTASGSWLAVSSLGIIHLWTPGRAALEEFGGVAGRWQPYIDGDQMVWLDTRHGAGSAGNAYNPEVYWMDLRTGQERRITHDPPERPAGQTDPVVSGEWVVWSDFRNAMVRNPAQSFTDRMDLYAFNLRTGREYVLYEGNKSTAPIIVGNDVIFGCGANGAAHLFRVPLPRP